MLPLEDITILDLSGGYPPSFGTRILADFGANVINIEGRPGSGYMSTEKKADVYQVNNRNKKSVALNLKSPKALEIFYELAKKADVIVEPFRPGVAKRLGIDYETISRINPGIIYCSLTGYGQDGPYSNMPGHDINFIGMAGALSLIGEAGGRPVMPLNLLADLAGAGLHGALGILIALAARNKTGKGQYIDISYTDCVISLLTGTPVVSEYFHDGIVPKRGETVPGCGYPYTNIYDTKDGKYITIGCVEPWLWESFCRLIGKEDFIKFHSQLDHFRVGPKGKDWKKVSDYLNKLFLTKTRDEWFDFLSTGDIPVGKVYSLDEIFRDPQVLHRNMLIEIEHPIHGKIKGPGIAIKLSETQGVVRSLPPMAGEHTTEILRQLGYNDREISELKIEGAID